MRCPYPTELHAAEGCRCLGPLPYWGPGPFNGGKSLGATSRHIYYRVDEGGIMTTRDERTKHYLFLTASVTLNCDARVAR
jgi:hypothetical protein